MSDYDDNDSDLLAAELGDLGKQAPLTPAGEWPAVSSKPSVRGGISEKGPWARLTVPFIITDDEVKAKMAPREPRARYEMWLDVVKDGDTARGFRIANEGDQEGANWQLRRLARVLGVEDGRLGNVLELEGRYARVNVVHKERDQDPDVKDAVVTRVIAQE